MYFTTTYVFVEKKEKKYFCYALLPVSNTTAKGSRCMMEIFWSMLNTKVFWGICLTCQLLLLLLLLFHFFLRGGGGGGGGG